jgi:DNA adenine methylase
MYENIQEHPDELADMLETHFKTYENINTFKLGSKPPKNRNSMKYEEGLLSKENYYYWARCRYNQDKKGTISNSALFIFLNKTCFRGLYREGPKGMNTAFGHYKVINNKLTKEQIKKLSHMFEGVNFSCCDFGEAIKQAKEEDLIYLDPPYMQDSESPFLKYVEKGFEMKDHKRLFDMIKTLDEKKISFIMSNSKTEHIKKAFEKYHQEEITARRAINSKNPRDTSQEIIIWNI